MATNYKKHVMQKLTPEIVSGMLAGLCNKSECGNCAISGLCDLAFGEKSGVYAKGWLEWLQEECDE